MESNVEESSDLPLPCLSSSQRREKLKQMVYSAVPQLFCKLLLNKWYMLKLVCFSVVLSSGHFVKNFKKKVCVCVGAGGGREKTH